MLQDYPQTTFKHKELSRGKKKIIDYFRFLYNFVCIATSLITLLRHKKYDIIYVQHLSVLPIVMAVAKLFPTDIVAHVHVKYDDRKALWLINKSLSSQNVKKIIGVSNYALSQLSKQNLSKSVVVYNHVGSNLTTVLRKPISYKIAIVGDIAHSKGQIVLAEALNILPQKLECHVVGSIVDDDYAQRVGQTNDKLIFAGMVPNVREYLTINDIDMVVVASISGETFSLSMTEAWSIGLPTIASNDTGMKELVSTFLPEHKDLMLFKTGSARELAAKLQQMYASTDQMHSISTSAHSVVVDNFDMLTFSKKITNIVNEL